MAVPYALQASTPTDILRCERGSIAIIFGLTMLPMLALVGTTIDYTSAVMARSSLQQATDATVLAISKSAQEGASQAQLKMAAITHLRATSTDPRAQVDGEPTISPDKTKVCMASRSYVDTAVMRIFRINTVAVAASACTITNNASFEIAMVLDTTGSMASSDGTTSKIASLRKAATQFIDYMYDSPTLAPRVKISVVPFAAAVAVDPAAYRTADWVDTSAQSSWHWKSPLFVNDSSFSSRFEIYAKLKAMRSEWDWQGCFEEQPYPANVRDTPPSTTAPDTLFVPMLAPDEPDGEYKNSSGKAVDNPYTYRNDYLDDHSSACTSSQPTGTTLANERVKQSRTCKYKSGTRTTSSPGSYGPQYACTASPLLRMTDARATLKAKVGGLQASGNTNIHQGLIWGWRSLSPNAPFRDGKPYGAPDVVKIIVLMTDGMNTWTDTNSPLNGSEYTPYGYYNTANERLPISNRNLTSAAGARNAVDALTRETCANARTAGVIIYTIGFSVKNDAIDSQGLTLLKDCAGNTSRAFVANDANSLLDAFAQIGSSIGALRLSN